MAPTKSAIVREISLLLGFEPPAMSTGSTEPKAFFALINKSLGLGLNPLGHKQELARGIVEASGMVWEPEFYSRGSTVTLKGLKAVADSVFLLVAP
jgi:hypothetical protein